MFKPLTITTSLLCLAALTLGGCSRSAPEDHTSLSLSPGKDPGKPSKKLTMVWHHHSTGDNLLAGGLLDALRANNVAFYDINYKEAKVDGYVIGDHTDPPDFPKNFNTPKYLDTIKSWELKGGKKQHDVVMFKSCYPSSDLKSDKMLADYKAWYTSMLPTFKANPEILFIAMSSPPLVKGHTKPEHAKRARQWAKWITTEYATELKNVQVFDLFNALAVLEGKPDENTLVPQFAEDKYDSHPTTAGAKAATRMFVPWFNRILRDAGLDK
jgi:hypothetical protein